MATTSNSNTQAIVQTGGQFSTSSTSARFKDTDYGTKALGDPKQLKRFFAQLNPIVQQIKAQGDTGVNVGNFDADVLTFPVPAYQSDWTPLTAQGGTTTGGNTIVCFDGTNAFLAVRKDAWGTVQFYASITAGGAAGTTFVTLPTEFWPAANFNAPVVVTPALTFQAWTVSKTGTIKHNGAAATVYGGTYLTWPAANLSPGTVPGAFPINVKVAQGRTPAAVFFMGAKPTQSQGQDIYKLATGVLSCPIGLAWTWLSGTAPSTSDSQKTNTIRIDSIPGLTTGVGYNVSILVLYSLTGQSSGG